MCKTRKVPAIRTRFYTREGKIAESEAEDNGTV